MVFHNYQTPEVTGVKFLNKSVETDELCRNIYRTMVHQYHKISHLHKHCSTKINLIK